MSSFRLLLLLLAVQGSLSAQENPAKIFTEKNPVSDARLGPPKTLNGYFPFEVPTSKQAWNDRAKEVRERVLVANGLWPMPERTPLAPVIHGAIDRGEYTVEKVFFASMPGHYVTGNLYRPTAKTEGKRPAILSPHGHWKDGRFYDAGEVAAKKQIDIKAEKTIEGARFPLQARFAQLARMGFVVFHYDMVGYADSTAITHRVGFTDVNAELRLQNFMGLQTWNAIRSLDFLLSLPEVDPKKIGVTGASGGGTQTFILCGIDERPAVAFPAVMVSTAMQGGCVCENCSYLRVGTGNIELAGLFAPKPLAMSGAHDWTIDIETKGLPELKKLYRLVGDEKNVEAKCFPQFEHNYNQVSREMMYRWFSTHLLGKEGDVAEQKFQPVPPKELSVFDDKHPHPSDELPAEKLREVMTQSSETQMKKLLPKDAATLAEFRRVIGTALKVLVNDTLPLTKAFEDVQPPVQGKLASGVITQQYVLSRTGAKESVPVLGLTPEGATGEVVLWIHPKGKASLLEEGKPVPAAQLLLDKKWTILSPDVFLTGELTKAKAGAVDEKFAGFTFGYNRSVLAQRVHDILTLSAFARDRLNAKKIHLVGFESAGPWVVLARALAGEAISRTAADLNQFRFAGITSTADEMMLPGAVKYGDLASFLALCAPGEVLVHNHAGTNTGQVSKAAYVAADSEKKLTRSQEKLKPVDVIQWLLR